MPAPLSAQVPVEEAPPSKFTFGPLGLGPRIALRNVGIDTNPLNQPGETKSDFTATIVPGLDSRLRIGRGRLTAKTGVEFVHFNKSRTQRSANLNQEARAELVLNHISPYAFGYYLKTRQRLNQEVDLRVQQKLTGGGFGTSLRVGSRLRFDLEGRGTRFRFGEGTHGNENIAKALDRDVEVGTLATRYTLTRLTTFVVRSEVQRERFRLSPDRNSNSISVIPGLELKPAALIAGRVFVGFRHFSPLDRSVPAFAGVVGRIETLYLWRESTQFGLVADRNIEYSVSEEQPYFVNNNGLLSVTQVIGLNWYVAGRVGESRLNYRDFVSGIRPQRIDRVLMHGVGFARRLGTDIRIGLDVDYVRRRSSVAANTYEGYRVGSSITYGS